MPEFTEDLILAAIAAASAIIGVRLGARLTKKTDLALKKREEKIDACADFMAAVFPAINGIKTDRQEATKEIGIAISRVNLLCSDETFKAASKIVDQIVKNEMTIDRTSEAIANFISSARKDFEEN